MRINKNIIMPFLNVIVLDNGFVVDTQNNKRFLFSVTIISNKCGHVKNVK